MQMQTVMVLVTTKVVLNPMLAQTKPEPQPSTATDALTAMATSVLTLTSTGCLHKVATHSLMSRLNGPMRTLTAMVTTQQALHQMTAQPFVTHRPSTDLVALTPMVTAIRILMQRGQSQMVQMHASTVVETRRKIESVATMKMVTATQTQALIGPLTTALMPMSKIQLVGLRKPLQMQTAFPADFQSFTVLVELF